MALTDSLISDWVMDEASGSNAADSVDSNTGTQINTVGQGTALILGTHSRTFLAASAQSIAFPSGIVSGTVQWSLEFWFSSGTIEQWARVFDFGTGHNVFIFFSLQSGAANNSGAMTGDLKVGGKETFASTTVIMQANTVYQVVVTCTNLRCTFYLNGKPATGVAGQDASGSTLAPTQPWVGKSQFDDIGDRRLTGNVQQGRLWFRELQLNEVAALFNGNLGLAKASLATAIIPPMPTPNQYGRKTYLGAFFREADNTLMMLESWDLVYWTPFPSTYTPPGGSIVRDPCITYWNGAFWLAYTNAASGNTSFDIAKADNLSLSSWTFVTHVDTSSVVSTGNTWSPTWVRNADGSAYIDPSTGRPTLLVTLLPTSGGNNATYQMNPTNDAMATWSGCTAVTGSALVANSIAPAAIFDNGTWWLWYKDETNGYCILASSTTDYKSGYNTAVISGNGLGFGSNQAEGAFPIKVNGPWGVWYIFVDRYGPDFGVGFFAAGASFASPTNLAGLSADTAPRNGSVMATPQVLNNEGAPFPNNINTNFPGGVEAGGVAKAVAGGWM